MKTQRRPTPVDILEVAKDPATHAALDFNKHEVVNPRTKYQRIPLISTAHNPDEVNVLNTTPVWIFEGETNFGCRPESEKNIKKKAGLLTEEDAKKRDRYVASVTLSLSPHYTKALRTIDEYHEAQLNTFKHKLNPAIRKNITHNPMRVDGKNKIDKATGQATGEVYPDTVKVAVKVKQNADGTHGLEPKFCVKGNPNIEVDPSTYKGKMWIFVSPEYVWYTAKHETGIKKFLGRAFCELKESYAEGGDYDEFIPDQFKASDSMQTSNTTSSSATNDVNVPAAGQQVSGNVDQQAFEDLQAIANDQTKFSTKRKRSTTASESSKKSKH